MGPQTPQSPTPAAALRPALAILLLLASLAASAENWPRFRGPTGQGISSERNVPIRWSAAENIRWKTPIPGQGWSSPIVFGNRVWVSTVTDGQTRARLIALDRDTVWVVYGDGTIAAVDAATGKVQWRNEEVRFYSRHGLGSSPILHDGLVIMAFDGSNRVEKAGDWPNNSDDEQLGWRIPWDKAEVVALNAKTGERVWTGRRGKSRIAHVTPNIISTDDGPILVSPAGDAIQGFDPKTGKLLWTVYSQGEGVTPSFAAGDGLIFTSSGFERTTLRVVRLGGSGDVTATHIAWEQRKGAPTQPSLLYVSPRLYTITDGGIAHCLDGKTGEILYAERVGGNHCASPVYADGHIYFLSEAGETTVIKEGPEFEIVSRNPLEERCQASIAISEGRLFIRGEKHLFCVGR
jgi:outer membrane protein assembly factor BamB